MFIILTDKFHKHFLCQKKDALKKQNQGSKKFDVHTSQFYVTFLVKSLPMIVAFKLTFYNSNAMDKNLGTNK